MKRILILLNAWLISGVLYDASHLALAAEKSPDTIVISFVGSKPSQIYSPIKGTICKAGGECIKADVIRLRIGEDTIEFNARFKRPIKVLDGVY